MIYPKSIYLSTWAFVNVGLWDYQAWDIFLLLVLTLPRFIDNKSRDAVLEVLRSLASRDPLFVGHNNKEAEIEGILPKIAQWINAESARVCSPGVRRCVAFYTYLPPCICEYLKCDCSSSAAGERFVLLTWCSGILDLSLSKVDGFAQNSSFPVLVSALAFLTDSLFDHGVKSSLRHSSLVHTRRLLRQVGLIRHHAQSVVSSRVDVHQHYKSIPSVLDVLLKEAKTHSSPLIFGPLMGVCVDVSIRLKPATKREEGTAVIQLKQV